jgi:hypothetical protein
MSSIPVPDEQTLYSSRRQDDLDALAWPVFSQHALDLLRSAGEVLHPAPGELLWDAGDQYDLYLVLAGGVLLVDRRDDRGVFIIEEGDFVGELGMLIGQRAFLSGVAMDATALLRVRVQVSCSPETTTATCIGFRSLPSATSSRTGLCGVRTHPLGQSSPRPARCLRPARSW